VTTQLGPVDVCNMALSQIAARASVTSITPSDGTVAGDACALLYQPTVDAFARAAHWNCLRFATGNGKTKVPVLTLLAAAPGTPENVNGTTLPPAPAPWLYEYALPPDCLRARFIVPQIGSQAPSPPLTTGSTMYTPLLSRNAGVPFTVAVDFDQDGNEIAVLLTNVGTALAGPPILVYTRRLQNIGLWDSQFLMGAKAALAAWLVNPVNASASMLQGAMAIAKGTLDAARISDGNEGPQSADHVPDWIAGRYGGRGRIFAGGFFSSWDAFAFPGGITY
jgi:hypothetical protein